MGEYLCRTGTAAGPYAGRVRPLRFEFLLESINVLTPRVPRRSPLARCRPLYLGPGATWPVVPHSCKPRAHMRIHWPGVLLPLLQVPSGQVSASLPDPWGDMAAAYLRSLLAAQQGERAEACKEYRNGYAAPLASMLNSDKVGRVWR